MPIIYIYILSIWKESRINLCSSLGKHKTFWDYGLGIIVFNATFNNISVISWQSVLLVEETGGPGEKHRPVASHCQTLSHNVVSSTERFSDVYYNIIWITKKQHNFNNEQSADWSYTAWVILVLRER
jgi:hypothetical protein